MENINVGHQAIGIMGARTGITVEMAKPGHCLESAIAAGQVHAIEAGRRRQDVIRCLQGNLWLTQKGDLNDYRLRTGEVFIAKKPGRILVYAFKDARIQVASTRDISC